MTKPVSCNFYEIKDNVAVSKANSKIKIDTRDKILQVCLSCEENEECIMSHKVYKSIKK